ncbi:MAG: type II toxin-antitoxin system MqsA family antitoxin [Luteolibacter sp.]
MKTKTSTTQGHPCFECDGGILLSVRESFTTRTSEGLEITIPDVPMERCNSCGDTVLSGEATAYMNDYLDRAVSRLSREELQAFLDQYQLSQREAEQILGLGEKMIGRWLKGPFQVSASISNYIRVLMADPGAFEILKARKWAADRTKIAS